MKGRIQHRGLEKGDRTKGISSGGKRYVFCPAQEHQVHLGVCRERRIRACRKCRYASGQLSLFDMIDQEKRRKKRGRK